MHEDISGLLFLIACVAIGLIIMSLQVNVQV